MIQPKGKCGELHYYYILPSLPQNPPIPHTLPHMHHLDPAAVPETKGFIGERFDADAGLQYLNARYYDPKLAMFIQPDWFEVTKAGVGTNRYAYSLNDPVNLRDPGGNRSFWEAVGDLFRSKEERVEANSDRARWAVEAISQAQSQYNSGAIELEAANEIIQRERRHLKSYLDIIEKNGGNAGGLARDIVFGSMDMGVGLVGGAAAIKAGNVVLYGKNTGRVFWSGGTMTEAARIAKANGMVTVEMTRVGKVLTAATSSMLKAGVPWKAIRPAWVITSKGFAAGATGTAIAVLGKVVDPKSVWLQHELPILLRKGVQIVTQYVH